MKILQKIALVTGGASGIGAATVRRFVSEGAVVCIADRDDVLGEALAAELGEQTEFVHLDVTDDAGWGRVMAHILGRHGRLDIMVNSAGIAIYGNIDSTPLRDWEQVLAVNATGTFLACSHAVRAMRASGGGSIVNIASGNAIHAHPELLAYASSKAAVVQLTKCVAIHCGKQGYNIRCNAVLPGGTDTPLLMSQEGERQDDRAALERMMAEIHALGRMGRPEEIAAAVLFLASDEASFITASALVADGGMTEL